MKLDKEILNNKILTLPIFYSDNSCEDEIYRRITDFHDLLSHCEETDTTWLNKILMFRDQLKQMYEEYYLGHVNSAYSHFQDAIAFVLEDDMAIKSDIPDEPLYRARVNNDNRDYKNEEMFHIKYSERSKVSTQRFSFPGLPCLYLGGSSYVCWLELNRPEFDKFQVASIRPSTGEKRKRVLDLSIHPATYFNEIERRENGEEVEHEELTLEKYLQYWPVIAACSMAVKNEADPFKPEYIFPQFLLQRVLENELSVFQDIDGIKYMSVKAGRISMHQYTSDYRTYTNYVFPSTSKTQNRDGFCEELSSYFKIINNFSGKELQIVSDFVREKGVKWAKINNVREEVQKTTLEDAVIYGSNDRKYPYKDSIFRRIEKILENANLEDGTVVFQQASKEDITDLFKT